MRKVVLIFLCLCLALFAGCGPKRVAVKYADTYLEKQVEKRLPLYEEQSETLSRDVDKFLNDHKARVREIIPFLEKIDFESANSLEEQWPKFQDAYLDIAHDFSKILAKHMANFDAKQKSDFLRRMKAENDEIFERDRNERRAKIESRIKQLLGSITPEQKKILKNHQKTFDEQVIVRSERRTKLLSKFTDILSQDLSKETKQDMIEKTFVEYQNESLKGTKNLEIAKEFVPTLTKSQKITLKNNISEVKELITYFLETAY